MNSSLSSISSLESVDSAKEESTLQETKMDCSFKYAKRSRFHPLLTSSKVSLVNKSKSKISSDFALNKKLTPFKTSSRRSLLNESKRTAINLEESITSNVTTSLNDSDFSCKCYTIDIYEKIYSLSSDSMLTNRNTSSSTLLSLNDKKRLTFNEFIKNEIYSNYF